MLNPHTHLGIHPLGLQKKSSQLSWQNKAESELTPLLVSVFLFLSVFALGLRVIDNRYGTAYQTRESQPRHELNGADFEFLSRGMRSILGVKTAQAAEFDESRLKAEPLNRHIELNVAPGEVVPVELYFRNLGTETWKNEGFGYISVYTTQPRYHAGVLAHESWLSSSHPARLSTGSVAPGAVGVLTFMVKAPQTAGEYSDWFQLASEDTAWVWGGHIQVTLKVNQPGTLVPGTIAISEPIPVPASVLPPTVPTSSKPVTTQVNVFGPAPRGSLMLTSTRQIIGSAHKPHEVTVAFKNNGIYPWNERQVRFRGFTTATVTDASLRHGSWPSNDTLVIDRSGITEPGHLTFMTFTIMTPEKRGEYIVRLGLVVDGQEVDGAYLDIPMTVTDNYSAPRYIAPVTTSSTAFIPSVNGSEPEIRVGVYYSEISHEEFVSNVPYEVRDANGKLLASFQAGTPVQVWYDNPTQSYILTNGLVNITSKSWLSFESLDKSGIFTLLSHIDRPAWNQTLNDNRFRGVIEFRRHSSGRVWIINRLPMEQYLYGLAETSNNAPAEFMKSLAVAARSYGNYHLNHPGKYDHFTVGALNDQVYKGYGAELRYSNFVVGVRATAGQVVTYNGDMVITPYYTWSDGRTRSWAEVWGGSKPWLVSVSAPYDAGKTLFGHGVGMSAWDAIGRANAGASYDIILNHFYSGTDLKDLY